ncbi:MAG: hypothetical protein QM669_05870 [Siphonobacter sp.]
MAYKYTRDVPFDYHFIDSDFDKRHQAERQLGTLAFVFGALAIFISCLGWFGFASFMAVSITLLTVSYQAIRTAAANPVKSLKTE